MKNASIICAQVISGYVMLIATAGLLINIIVAKMLHSNHVHDHDKRVLPNQTVLVGSNIVAITIRKLSALQKPF